MLMNERLFDLTLLIQGEGLNGDLLDPECQSFHPKRLFITLGLSTDTNTKCHQDNRMGLKSMVNFI